MYNIPHPSVRVVKMETEKITIRLPIKHLRAIDTFIKLGEFSTRSEAIRRAISMLIEETSKRIYEKQQMWEKIQKLETFTEETDRYNKR